MSNSRRVIQGLSTWSINFISGTDWQDDGWNKKPISSPRLAILKGSRKIIERLQPANPHPSSANKMYNPAYPHPPRSTLPKFTSRIVLSKLFQTIDFFVFNIQKLHSARPLSASHDMSSCRLGSPSIFDATPMSSPQVSDRSWHPDSGAVSKIAFEGRERIDPLC